MTKSHCVKSHCAKSDDCCTNSYGDILKVKTLAALCCVLGLVSDLEGALQDDKGETPDMNVRQTAKYLQDYLVANPHVLPARDGTGTGTTANDLRTFGAFKYLDCVCKKVPFLWRECVVTLPDGSVVSIFDLLNSPSSAYGGDKEAWIKAVCCLKRHYGQIKSVLEHHH